MSRVEELKSKELLTGKEKEELLVELAEENVVIDGSEESKLLKSLMDERNYIGIDKEYSQHFEDFIYYAYIYEVDGKQIAIELDLDSEQKYKFKYDTNKKPRYLLS